MEENNVETDKLKLFQVLEDKGKLPYTVMWIGAHMLPSIEHFGKLEDAQTKVKYLKTLGCRPSLLLDLNQAIF